jgi:hypothetical protein
MKPIQALLITSTGEVVSEFRAFSDMGLPTISGNFYGGTLHLQIARTALAAVEKGALSSGPFTQDKLSQAYPEIAFEQFRSSYGESGLTYFLIGTLCWETSS